MWGQQVAAVIGALVSLAWVAVAGYVIYLLRQTLPRAIGRLSGFEVYGVKLSLSASDAMAAAIELATKNERWDVVVPVADQTAALNRAKKESALLERAEILWVDDHPSNNRYEARMLRSFGAIITFASTTEDALAALAQATERHQPFHLILSDISRDFPLPADPKGGLAMLDRLKDAKVTLPVVLYVGSIDPAAGVPAGAFAVCNRPDHLLLYTLDALSRTRSG
jgi:CheY-like chemotaxis protein